MKISKSGELVRGMVRDEKRGVEKKRHSSSSTSPYLDQKGQKNAFQGTRGQKGIAGIR